MKPRNQTPTEVAPSEAPKTDLPLPPRTRKLFGSSTSKLDLKGRVRAGYRPRWINDEPGRIDLAKECGYEHIKDNKGRPMFIVVDRAGMKAYAMEIPEEFYQEDFKLKQARDDQTMEALMRKPIPDAGYRPTVADTGQPRTQQQTVVGSGSFG